MQHGVNLLPADVLLRQQNRKVICFWRSTACVTAFCLLTVFLAQRRDLKAMEEVLADSNRDTATSRKIIEETTLLQNRLKALRETTTKQKQIRSLHPPTSVLALLEKMRTELQGQMQLQNLDFADRPQPRAAVAEANNSAPERSGHQVRFSFTVASPEAATGVLEFLKQSGRFTDVTLEGSLQQQGSSSDLSFSVRCTF